MMDMSDAHPMDQHTRIAHYLTQTKHVTLTPRQKRQAKRMRVRAMARKGLLPAKHAAGNTSKGTSSMPPAPQ